MPPVPKKTGLGSSLADKLKGVNVKPPVICPSCGQLMVPRQGGEFYGCSGYPACTRTMQAYEVDRLLKGGGPRKVDVTRLPKSVETGFQPSTRALVEQAIINRETAPLVAKLVQVPETCAEGVEVILKLVPLFNDRDRERLFYNLSLTFCLDCGREKCVCSPVQY